MPAHRERPGKVGIVSRSASLTSEVIEQISAQRLGQSASIGIGGDPVHGMGFVDCLKLFFADPDTDRSEEHTSELQSLMRISYAVFCLKKKTYTHNRHTPIHSPQDTHTYLPSPYKH